MYYGARKQVHSPNNFTQYWSEKGWTEGFGPENLFLDKAVALKAIAEQAKSYQEFFPDVRADFHLIEAEINPRRLKRIRHAMSQMFR